MFLVEYLFLFRQILFIAAAVFIVGLRVAIWQECIPANTNDIDRHEPVSHGDEIEVDGLERWPHGPIDQQRREKVVVPVLLDIRPRLALHETHDDKVEGNAHGREPNLVDADAQQRGLDGMARGPEGRRSRGGVLEAGQEWVPFRADRGKDYAAIDPRAQRAGVVVASVVCVWELGNSIANGKQGLNLIKQKKTKKKKKKKREALEG